MCELCSYCCANSISESTANSCPYSDSLICFAAYFCPYTGSHSRTYSSAVACAYSRAYSAAHSRTYPGTVTCTNSTADFAKRGE